MNTFSRFAVAAVLVAGFAGVANAQSQSRHAHQADADRYYALSEGRSGIVEPSAATSGAVAPSESQTVMGLRVPR